jgi:hypothetical protein
VFGRELVLYKVALLLVALKSWPCSYMTSLFAALHGGDRGLGGALSSAAESRMENVASWYERAIQITASPLSRRPSAASKIQFKGTCVARRAARYIRP